MSGAGRATRGRTSPGRLRHLDLWVARHLRPRGLVVDVGVGWRPFTTLELADALPACAVVGVEIDPDRVAECRAVAPQLDVRQGGFDLPLARGEQPVVVRAMNLLRQYAAADADDALDQLARPLEPGGWLIDGRTDRSGSCTVARVHVRTQGGRQVALLVCHTSFDAGFSPMQAQHLLPSDLGGPHRPVSLVAPLFAAWTTATAAAREDGHRDPRATFIAAAERIEAPIVRDRWGWRRGYLACWLSGTQRSIAPK